MKKLIASVAVLALGFVAVGCSEPTKPGTLITKTPVGSPAMTTTSATTSVPAGSGK